MDWAIWFFTDRIFGTFFLAAIAYGIAKLVKIPLPEAAAAIAFLLALFTLPTYPRYKFEQDTYAELAKHPEYRIAQTTHWGSFSEPLTWFRSFMGHFRAVAPDPVAGDEEEGMAAFRQIVFRYGEQPQQWMHFVFCNENRMSSSMRDSSGEFHLTSRDWQQISSENRVIFCESDWSIQNDHALNHLLRNNRRPEACIYPFEGSHGLIEQGQITC